MSKKVILNLFLDGTGNNKVHDRATGTHTNVARLHDTLEANYRFNISQVNPEKPNENGASDPNQIKKGAEGNLNAFGAFFNHSASTGGPDSGSGEKVAPPEIPDNGPLVMNLYQDGVGSRGDGSFADRIEGATGLGMEPRIENVIKAVSAIRATYGEDVEIEINGVSFSRGSAEAKVLLNLLNERFSELHAHVSTFVEYDPVFAVGVPPLTDNLADYNDGYPSGPATSGARIVEIYAGDEHRDTFDLRNYSDSQAEYQVSPGAHAQIGGSYLNDILAAGPLGMAMNEFMDSGLSFGEIPLDDQIRMALYNEVIENPYLVRALITDSRLASNDLLHPGSEAFPMELPQDYEFDRDGGGREVRNPGANEEHAALLDAIAHSDSSVEDIAAMGYGPIPLPFELPEDLQHMINAFGERIAQLSFTEGDPDSIEAFLADFQEAFADLSEQAGWLHQTADGVSVEQGMMADTLLAYTEVIGGRVGILEDNTVQEQAEQQLWDEANHEAAIRGAELDVMGSGLDLRDAIDSGDGIRIAQEGLGYLSSLNDHQEALFGEDHGFLDPDEEAVVDGLEHGLGLGLAIDSGDGLEIAGSSIDLLLDIDNFVEANNGEFLPGNSEGYAGLASAGLELVSALDSGDGWEIASSITSVAQGIDTAIVDIDGGSGAVGGAASAVGLAVNIASLDDVFASGDAMQEAYTVASTVNNAIGTYNAVAGMADMTPVTDIPALGYVAAAVQLVEGDATGAAVTAASTYLMSCGPYGWAAAAVLQVANMLGLFGGDDPPSATVNFALGDDGSVTMDVHGDSEMFDAARGYGSMLTDVLQSYQDSGGRLVVDGTLPSLVVEADSGPKICYTSEYGGSVTLNAGDPSRIGIDMYGALVARDRGDRVDEAVRLATDAGGNVDLAQVEARLSSLGFSRDGMTWTFGETHSRIGHVYGVGGLHGGGNADGPEGEHFTARDSDITSLPLEEEQLPGQKVGRVLRTVSLNQNLAGSGSMLLAMGLGLDVDHAVAAATPSGGEADLDDVPVPAMSRSGAQDSAPAADTDTNGTVSAPEPDSVLIPSYSNAMPTSDDSDLHAFLATLRPGMVSGYGMTGFSLPAVSGARLEAGSGDDFRPAPVPEISSPARSSDRFVPEAPERMAQASLQPATDGWPGNVEPDRPDHIPVASNIPAAGANNDPSVQEGRHVPSPTPTMTQEPDRPVPDAEPLPPGVEPGAEMTVDQDTDLVFLQSALAGEQTPGYSKVDDQPVLASLRSTEHGTVSMDADGTIRFVPEPGFTGEASFEYDLMGPDGETTTYRSTILVRDVNDAPQPVDDHAAIGEGEVFFVDTLLDNDADSDGETLRFDHFRGLEHGELTMIGDRLAFVPEPGFTGDVNFSYWVTDGPGTYPHMGRATLTVEDRNLGVVTGEDRFLILEDQALQLDADQLLANDREFDGEEFTISAVGQAVHGQVEMAGDGTITFSPDQDYAGDQAGFTYTAVDGSGHASMGLVSIEAQNLRDAPRVIADSLEGVGEEGSLMLDSELMSRFVADADGDVLRFDSITGIVGGHLERQGNELVFVADEDSDGQGGFDYQIGDGHSGFVEGHLDFTLAVDTDEDGGTEEEGHATDGNVEQPEADTVAADSDGLTTDLQADDPATDGPGMDVAADADGGLVDNPAGDEDGTEGGIDVQDPILVAGQDELSTLEESPLTTSVSTLMQNDTVQAGELVFLGLGDAIHGQVALADDGTITFTPETDYFGDQAGFTYLIGDESGNEATGEVRIEVENINDAPEIFLDRLLISEDESVTFTSEEIARFAGDVDLDALSFTGLAAEHGTFQEADGVVSFVPEQDFYGVTWFDYSISDGNGGEVSGHMQVEVAPVNDVPEVAVTEAVMDEDGEIRFGLDSLLAGAVDVEDGTALRITDVTASQYGDAWLDADGMIHFMPDDDFFGNGWFEYGVRDREGGVGTGRVEVEVRGENDAPVAADDRHIAAWGNNGYDNVFDPALLLANDYDVDLDRLSIASLGEAEHGQVSLDDSGRIHYRAATDGWVGVDRFSYTVDDGHGGQAEAMAEVEVRLNMEPDAYSELLESQEDVILHISPSELLANDSDLDGDSLFITSVGNAEHGTVSLLADGTISFAPELNYNADYAGQAGFDYTISDGISDPVTCRALVDPEPVNDAPILRGETIRGAVEDNTFSFTPEQLLANDTDVEAASSFENDSIHLHSISGAAHGSMSWDSTHGRIVYTPQANFNGTDTFSYQVADSHGALSTVSSHISVQAVNDNPVVRYDRESGAETAIWNRYRISDLLANDYDVDGDQLHIEHARVTSGHGSARISGRYLEVMPDMGQHRLEVSYDVTDGHGGTTGSRLTLDHIREHNFAPRFTGRYEVAWESGWETWFTFEAIDPNGGNSWGDHGDIVTISSSNVSKGDHVIKETSDIRNHNQSFKFEGNFDRGALTLTVVDHAGATGTIYIQISHLGPNGRHIYSPVVLDLDGDGVELVSIDQGIGFDWNRDGEAEATGWVGADDGLLVYDANHDLTVTRADEVLLRELVPGAATDLEGLRAMDDNADGIFSEHDAAWQDFGIWQDTNGNGVCEDGEFSSLEELDITSIDLNSDNLQEEIEGNTVYGHAQFTRADGSTGEVGDVALAGEEIEFIQVDASDDIGSIIPENGQGMTSEPVVVENDPLETAKVTDDTEAETVAGEVIDGTDSSTQASAMVENSGLEGGVEIDGNGATEESALESDTTEYPQEDSLVDIQTPDPAELDRLASQLQSDAAAGPISDEPVAEVPVDVFFVDTHTDPAGHEDFFPPDDTVDADDALLTVA